LKKVSLGGVQAAQAAARGAVGSVVAQSVVDKPVVVTVAVVVGHAERMVDAAGAGSAPADAGYVSLADDGEEVKLWMDEQGYPPEFFLKLENEGYDNFEMLGDLEMADLQEECGTWESINRCTPLACADTLYLRSQASTTRPCAAPSSPTRSSCTGR